MWIAAIFLVFDEILWLLQLADVVIVSRYTSELCVYPDRLGRLFR